MIILNVFFQVKPEQKQSFFTLMNTMIVESNQEAGCLRYQMGEDVTNENAYLLIEHWEDEQALQFHQETEHWKNFADQIGDHLSEKFVVQKFSN